MIKQINFFKKSIKLFWELELILRINEINCLMENCEKTYNTYVLRIKSVTD